MKIAVSSSESGLKDIVYPVFGRCPAFSIVTVEGKIIKNTDIIPNPGIREGGGAGIVAAQAVANAGADAVITGNCGPNALSVLFQAGIKVYSFSGSAENAVKNLLEGKLSAVTKPGASHFGMGFGGGFGRGRGFRGGRP